jgi:hypothetical protein
MSSKKNDDFVRRVAGYEPTGRTVGKLVRREEYRHPRTGKYAYVDTRDVPYNTEWSKTRRAD